MSKRSVSSCAALYCGIDVSAVALQVAVQPEGSEVFRRREFISSVVGHEQENLRG